MCLWVRGTAESSILDAAIPGTFWLTGLIKSLPRMDQANQSTGLRRLLHSNGAFHLAFIAFPAVSSPAHLQVPSTGEEQEILTLGKVSTCSALPWHLWSCIQTGASPWKGSWIF